MDFDALTDIGFTAGETRVYFALMKLAQTTIGPLSGEAKVTPAKCYPIMERLITKGLASSVMINGVKHFQALQPERLITYMKEKQRQLDMNTQKIEQLIPTIAALGGGPDKQYAAVYHGMQGIRMLYEDTFAVLKETGEDFICFTLGSEYQNKSAIRFFKQMDTHRSEHGLKTRIIGLRKQRAFFRQEFGTKKHVRYRFVDRSVPTGVIIYGNNVVTLLWQPEPVAFVIHSQKNAEVYKDFFEDLWKHAAA